MGKASSIPVDTAADIAIIGGGLAGLSMAAALSSLPLNIVIIEYTQSSINSPESDQEQSSYSPSFDDRALALSLASIKILQNIGVLSVDDVKACTAIEHIHVSDKGHFGMLRMAAEEVGEAHLGKVIPAPLLGEKLQRYIAQANYAASINVVDQASVTAVQHAPKNAVISVVKDNETQFVEAKTVVLADGGRSAIAEQVGLPSKSTDYQQVAVLANVVIDQSHRNIAYERFTETGPLALLPLRENEFKLVWTVSPKEQDEMLACSDVEFLTALQQRFGFRAGSFTKVSRRVAYPMQAKERAQIVAGRIALIGNAAHSLHPIAGQGFNLGLRDVACLAEIIADQFFQEEDLGDAVALMHYQALRQQDIQRTASFTDKLVKGFSTSAKPIAVLRTLGLLTLDRQPHIKQDLMRKLMGISGQQFRLMTGSSLLPDQSRDVSSESNSRHA